MAGKTITATAVISAADKTGSVFDKIAAKIKGVEKSAKAFEGMKGPQKFVGDFGAALDKLKATEREMAHIRKSWQNFDQAMDNVETVAKAQTVLGTLGHGGEHGAEDLEKLVLGLESQGVGSNPEKFKTYLNAFVKAKSLFPDLTGEKFQQYMQTSNA